MPTIQLTLHRSGLVKLKPDSYLGDIFWDFKSVCEKSGAQAKKEKGEWVNLAKFESLDSLITGIEELGIEVAIHPDVVSAIQAQQASAQQDKSQASERLHNITEELAKVGRFPFPYQIDDIMVMSQKKAVLNCNPMGSGKTMETLLSIPNNAPVLIICPSVAKGVWANEIKKWRLEEPEVTILNGRQKELEIGPGFTILNYEILPPLEWIQENWRVSCPGQCVLVADEAHMLKNSKTARTTKFKEIADVIMSKETDGRVYMLTGTPIMNRPMELWTILGLAKLEREAFGSWNRFTNLFNAYKGAYAWEWGEPVQPDVSDCLSRVMIRHEKEDILAQLPPKRVNYIPVTDFNKKALKGIDWDDIEEKLNQGVEFEQFSAARSALATAKIPAMLKYVESFEEADEALIVASAHRAPIDLLDERTGWATITGSTTPSERTRIVDEFQSGNLRGIGLTIKAGGVGITLTRASHMLFVDEDPTPGINEQCRDRIHRIGQRNSCTYHILVADHEIDTRISELLSEKHRLVYGTVNATGRRTKDEGYEQRSDTLTRVTQKATRLRTLQESEVKKSSRTGADSPGKQKALSCLETFCRFLDDAFYKSLLRQFNEKEGLTDKQWTLLIERTKDIHPPSSDKEIFTYNALAKLTALDPDNALTQNDIGFNKFDSTPGKRMYELASREGLSGEDWEKAHELIKKYHRQVGRYES